MSNKFVSDSFETLGGAVKSTAGQVKQVVKQIGDDVTESMGLKPADSAAGTNEQGGQQQQQQKSDDQIKKMEAENKAKSRKRYSEIREGIQKLQQNRTQSMLEYRKLGLTDNEKRGNQIKQLEEKPSFAKATDGKKELPPLPVQRASKKTEALRGVSG